MRHLHLQKLLVIIFLSYAHVSEAEEIYGAFGIKFGEALTAKQIGHCQADEYCTVEPDIPYYTFSHYSVRLSPIKNRVYEINGVGYLNSYLECINHAEKIANIINKKYGVKLDKSEHEGPNGNVFSTWSKTIGDLPKGIWALNSDNDGRKSIWLKCEDRSNIETSGSLKKAFPSLSISDVSIVITYRNKAIIKYEKIESMIDESGL